MPCEIFSPWPHPSPVGASKVCANDDQYALPSHKKRVEENGKIAAAVKPTPFPMRIAIQIRNGH